MKLNLNSIERYGGYKRKIKEEKVVFTDEVAFFWAFFFVRLQ